MGKIACLTGTALTTTTATVDSGLCEIQAQTYFRLLDVLKRTSAPKHAGTTKFDKGCLTALTLVFKDLAAAQKATSAVKPPRAHFMSYSPSSKVLVSPLITF